MNHKTMTAVQKMNRCGSKIEHNITKYKNNTKKQKHSQDAPRPSEREMCDFLKSKGFDDEVSKETFLACDSFGFEKIGSWKAFCLKVARTKRVEAKPLPVKPKKKNKETVTEEDKEELRRLWETLDETLINSQDEKNG